MFTGKPIAFSKGSFGAIGGKLQEFANKLKDALKQGRLALNEFKKNFNNKLRFKSGKIEVYSTAADGSRITTTLNYAAPLEKVNETLERYTNNNYAGLQAALPYLFSNTTPSVVTARTALLNVLGKADQSTSYKIGPYTIGELSQMGQSASDSFAEIMASYSKHTDEISGVGNGETFFTLQRLYGNVSISNATINIASSVVVTPNLSGNVYPSVNVGDTIVIDNEQKIVVDKGLTVAPSGTVSVNLANGNTLVTTASVGTLNLANCLLATGGTLKVTTGTFISVNNEMRQVASINAYGDYLTVYSAFNANCSGVSLYKETSFNVNTAFASTKTGQTVKVNSAFMSNSVCLDNVITGSGTSFTSYLQPGNKIYYDSKEYYVVSVTDTQIVVDQPLRFSENYPIFKVTNETPFYSITGDANNPDNILSNYALAEQMTNDKNFMSDFSVMARRANGTYQSVSAATPADSAQSLLQDELLLRANYIIKDFINDFRTDAIRNLSESALVTKLTEAQNRLTSVRDNVDDVVQQDLQVINAVKSLISGLIKLFVISCSKKKRKDGDSTSDDYLDLILEPNPETQGCEATTSDFIDDLDQIDVDFGPDQPYPPISPTVDIDPNIPANPALDPVDEIVGPYPTQPQGIGGEDFLGGNLDGTNPDATVPDDPCVKPC